MVFWKTKAGGEASEIGVVKAGELADDTVIVDSIIISEYMPNWGTDNILQETQKNPYHLHLFPQG